MNDVINHPSHYVKNAITLEPIELTGRLNSCIGQALQYIIRRKDKGNEVEDLRKAKFFIEWFGDNVYDGSTIFNVGTVCEEDVGTIIGFFEFQTQDNFLSDFLGALFVCNEATVNEDSLSDAVDLLENEINRLEGKDADGLDSH